MSKKSKSTRSTAEAIDKRVVDDQVVERERIQIVEEQLEVGKVLRENTVHIHTGVEEILEPYSVELESTVVDVHYVDINKVVDTLPQTRKEDGVTIIPVFEERLVLRKEIVLTQEVHLRHQTRIDTVEDEVALRKTKVELERDDEEEVLPM